MICPYCGEDPCGQHARCQEPDLFDAAESARLKREGMRVGADNNVETLQVARDIAVSLAQRFGQVEADMVMREMLRLYGVSTLGPAAGSLFKGPHWEWTGARVQSVRKLNHARELKVWQLR